jgi:hypothetical protein
MIKTLLFDLPDVAARAKSYGWLLPLIRSSFIFGGFLLFLLGEAVLFGDIWRKWRYAVDDDEGAAFRWRYRIYASPIAIWMAFCVYYIPDLRWMYYAVSWTTWAFVGLLFLAWLWDQVFSN